MCLGFRVQGSGGFLSMLGPQTLLPILLLEAPSQKRDTTWGVQGAADTTL